MSPERRSEILAEHRMLVRHRRKIDDRINELEGIIKLFDLRRAA